MIAYLDGTILEKESDSIVVLIGGVGLRVYATQNYLLTVEPGQRVRLHTHLIVREDLLALYGFIHRGSSIFFSVDGSQRCRSRLALNILSSAGVIPYAELLCKSSLTFYREFPASERKRHKIILQVKGKFQAPGEGQDFQASTGRF